MLQNFFFTSEYGLTGHPDNIADQVGDAILDTFLEHDPYARVGCNVMVMKDMIVVGGQITSNALLNIEQIVRNKIESIGYTKKGSGFDYESCQVIVQITPQASNIANAVSHGGAGDSGIMVGYACKDTTEFLPLTCFLLHRLSERIDLCRNSGLLEGFGPDGKLQLTIKYEDQRPIYLDNLVISIKHEKEQDTEEVLGTLLSKHVLDEVIPTNFVKPSTQIHIKPTIGFIVGGPKSDCGLSGRKVIADTYGGWSRHCGGGLSGKDPSKIDRWGTYLARYIAKNLVASGIADRCEVQLSYIFGQERPASLLVDFFNTGKVSEGTIEGLIPHIFPLSVLDVIETLKLRRPIYQKAGVYGHFGHTTSEFTWELTDRVDELLRRI